MYLSYSFAYIFRTITIYCSVVFSSDEKPHHFVKFFFWSGYQVISFPIFYPHSYVSNQVLCSKLNQSPVGFEIQLLKIPTLRLPLGETGHSSIQHSFRTADPFTAYSRTCCTLYIQNSTGLWSSCKPISFSKFNSHYTAPSYYCSHFF